MIVLQLCTDYADLAPGENGAAASSHVETNLFESLMFIVRNYQGDDEDPGERPNLFQEIVSDTVNLWTTLCLHKYAETNITQITAIVHACNLREDFYTYVYAINSEKQEM